MTKRRLSPSGQRRPCPAPAPERGALDPLKPGHPPLGVALSGGGIRATLMGLGTLRLLADIERLSDIRHLTSVSGGSIVAGLLGVHWDKLRARHFNRAVLDEQVTTPLLHTLTERSLQRALYFRLWKTLSPRTSRTNLLADLLAESLLGHTLLNELPTGVWFDINAANLTTGTRFRFTRDLLGDYITGSISTEGLDIRVADAVAWSCAVPGPFNTVTLRELALPCEPEVGPPELVDGGVYDNLGADAFKIRKEMPNLFSIVVNAGGSFDPWPGITPVPLIGDLWRANSVLYQQVAALRSRGLFERFTSTDGSALDGCLFTLRSPYPHDVPAKNLSTLTDFTKQNPPGTNDGNEELAVYPTNLKQIKPDIARRLIYRGWWLAGATLSAYASDLVDAVPTYAEPP